MGGRFDDTIPQGTLELLVLRSLADRERHEQSENRTRVCVARGTLSGAITLEPPSAPVTAVSRSLTV